MRFFLGTHMPHWLRDERFSGVPLFISDVRLRDRKSLPVAVTDWALDSGGFSEIAEFGTWRHGPHGLAARTRRYSDQIGRLQWAAPQDWMCEPWMLAKTGKTVAEHQALTIRSVLDLRTLWPDGPFIPVLQGFAIDDYLRHVDAYAKAGFDLEAERLVGLGSVCRRQATGDASEIVMRLQPIRLHGFGMKTTGLARYGGLLESADSMAWSFGGRRRGTCSEFKSSCANCAHWALEWRDRIGWNASLFGAAA